MVDVAVGFQPGREAILFGERRGTINTGFLAVDSGLEAGGGNLQEGPVAVGDLDGDGALDALSWVALGPSQCELRFFQGPFLEPVAPTVLETSTGLNCGFRPLRVTDVDDDGDLDLLGTSTTDDTYALFRNDGSGAFAEERTEVAGNQTVFLAELDGASPFEFGVSDTTNTRLFSTDDFQTPIATLNLQAFRGGVISSDVNNDGYVDLVVGQTASALGPAILFGEDPGVAPFAFAAAPVVAGDNTEPTISVRVLDVQLDGTLDIVQSINDFTTPGVFSRPVDALDAPAQISEFPAGPMTATDLNGDQLPDLMTLSFAGASPASVSGRPHLVFAPMSVAVAPGSVVEPFGAVDFNEVIGNVSLSSRVVMRPVQGAGDLLAGPSATRGVDESGSMVDLLRREVSGLGHVRQVAQPVYLSGDVSIFKVAADPPGARRFVLRDRLGARVDETSTTDFTRTGLNLDEGRGLIVHLPLTRTTSGALRVFVRVPDFATSDQVSADPLDDPRTLPRVDTASGPRNLIAVNYTWVELDLDDDGELTSGDGPRFVVDGDEIRALVDQLGVFVAVEDA